MPQAKLTDVQVLTFTIPHGEDGKSLTLNHGLQDQSGNSLDPDEIHHEMQNFSGAAFDGRLGCVLVIRSSPPDGTALIHVQTAENDSHGDWVFTIRFVTKYIHSIQSDDHTA